MGEERNQILNLPFLYIVLIFSLKIRLDVKILNVSNKGHAPYSLHKYKYLWECGEQGSGFKFLDGSFTHIYT